MPKFPDVKCVGMHFRGGDAVALAASLEEGEVLRLERETDNAHDGNAIKVFFESTHIGYVERGQAAWIAPLMDEGGAVTATVTRIEDVPNARGKVTQHPVMLINVDA